MVIKHFRMAKTDAERARAYRQRKKESLGSSWLKKENERVKKYYIKSCELSKKKLNARRSKIRQYVHKYRLRQKTEARDLKNENLPGSSSADTNTDVKFPVLQQHKKIPCQHVQKRLWQIQHLRHLPPGRGHLVL